MNTKLFLISALSVCTLSLNACPPPSSQTLSHQYETGALQWQIASREIDPHTLIHTAILENSPEVIWFLLSQGVNVNYQDKNGMLPLTVAILNRCHFAVEVLLAYGALADPNIKWNSMSLLALALNMNDLATAKLLVEYGTKATSQDLHKALYLSKQCPFAERADWAHFVQKLISQGTSVNPDADNQNPLSPALELAIDGDRSLLELMIKNGANLNCILEYEGRTPLMLVLLNKSRGDEAMIELASFLVKSGADVNQEDPWYGTPLTYAISLPDNAGFTEFRKFLVQSHANVNQKILNGDPNLIGLTPLQYAIKLNKMSCVQLLVEAGADVNNGNPSPMRLALDLNQPLIVQYLLQHGARG